LKTTSLLPAQPTNKIICLVADDEPPALEV